MELIYLYIEDYKNIKNQGFNFSSKFTSKYDENKMSFFILGLSAISYSYKIIFAKIFGL